MTAPLGSVADFVRGITFKPEDVVPVGQAGVVGCMRTKNVQEALDLEDVWGVSESLVKRRDQFLRAGDVLVSSANSWNLIGKCCPVPPLPWRSTFGGFVAVLRADEKQIDPRYLYRWFSAPRTQVTVRSFGQQTTNISNLNVDRCRRLEVPLLPLGEQRRIADILDRADAMRAKRREAISVAGSLRPACFVSMVGDPRRNRRSWPIATLGELISEGPQNGLYKPSSDYGSGTEILRIDGFYDGVVTGMARLKRVRVSDREREAYGLNEGDIVINRVNSREYLGKSALVPKLREPVLFESNMMRFAVDRTKADPVFVAAFLQTPFAKAQILSGAKDAINQSSVNQQDIKGITLPVPPLVIQREFARRVAAIDKLEVAHRASLAEMDALFASLQHRAFRGEL